MQDSSLTWDKVLNTIIYGSVYHLSASSYTGVTNFKKWSSFYGLHYLVFSGRGIVFLNLRKEYLNMTIFKIPILLLMKSRTFWCIERLPTSSYAGVTYFQIWSCFCPALYIWDVLVVIQIAWFLRLVCVSGCSLRIFVDSLFVYNDVSFILCNYYSRRGWTKAWTIDGIRESWSRKTFILGALQTRKRQNG